MYNDLYGMMNWPLIEGIEYTDIDNPHDLLGPHLTDKGLLIQAFIPDVDDVKVKYSGKISDMCKMDDAGFYAVLIETNKLIKYKLVITKGEEISEIDDPYAFEIGTDIKEFRKYNAGIFYDAYEYLGSHKCTINKVSGVRFCVWAPEAVRVSVVGGFNNWDGRRHQMTSIEDTGIFEIFIPGLDEGELYKYEIKKKGDENILKADPFAFSMEEKPGTASVIKDINNFTWTDNDWINKRTNQDISSQPVSIYELNIATFVKDENGNVNYKNVAKDIADYVLKMGYTHIELMPLAEYLSDDSLGYMTNYFFAPTNRYGTNEELMEFINYMHSKNIGVILDWTVNQFTSNEFGLAEFDGSCLFEHMNVLKKVNPRNGALLFNYGRPEVTSYLISNAFMLINKYHIDGLKVANTASMLYLDYDRQPGEWEANIYGGTENLEAIEFIKHFNSIIHRLNKGVITISDDNSGFPEITGAVSETCIGFDLKINVEWRKDFLSYMSVPSYLRQGHYNELSLSMIYQYSDNFIVGYPESEFINGSSSLIGRMTGDTEERKFDNMKLALAYEYVHPGKKIIFMGQDIAQYAQWLPGGSIDMDILKVDKHKNINTMISAINEVYKNEKALYELDNVVEGFEWINNISARESILTFARKGKEEDELLVIVCNFDAVDREDYKIGVPKKGKYKEIFTTNNKNFGGNGFVNSRLKQSKTDECDGREESIRINVPALSVSILKYSRVDEKIVDNKSAKQAVAKKEAKTVTKPVVKTAAKAKETVKPAVKTTKKTVVKTEEKQVAKTDTKIKSTIKKEK